MTTQINAAAMANMSVSDLAKALKPMSETDRKVALETVLSFGSFLSEDKIQEFLNDLNTELGSNYKTADFNCLKSAQTSTAEVKKETEYFTGSNAFIAGVLVGVVADQIINDLNVTSAVAGTATAAAGYLLREKINERAQSTTTKLAWGVFGGATTIAASYATRGVMGFFDEESVEESADFI